MEICKVPFDQIPQLSEKDIAYATGHDGLRPFYKYEISLDAFEQVIEDKKKDKTDRKAQIQRNPGDSYRPAQKCRQT